MMTITETTNRNDSREYEAPGWIAIARETAATLAATAAQHDESGDFNHAAFALLRANEISSMLVPADCGGPGATHAEACAVLTELGKGDPAAAVTLSMQFHLVATQVWRHKHGQPAAEILRRIHDEKLILISTGATDWTDSYGSAVKVEGGFRISARKAPSSGAPAGDLLVTSVPWDDAPDGPKVVHCNVPFTAEGVSIDETWNSMGIRASGSHTVVLDDVFVPDEAVSLIRPPGWHPVWNAVIGAAMPLIMSAYLGAAERATVVATEFAERKANQPHVPLLVGEMLNAYAIAHDAVAAMVGASNDLTFDNTDEHAAYVLTRKTVASEAMIDTARRAVEVVGGAGYARGFELERLFRDIHGSQFHPLPAVKQVQFTGRLALGLDPLD